MGCRRRWWGSGGKDCSVDNSSHFPRGGSRKEIVIFLCIFDGGGG